MATAAVLSPSPVQQFFGPNGTPLAGGKVATYAAGSSTPIATYVDSTATTTNSNPITLSSYGTANIWLLPNVGYKFIVSDSSGNIISTTDQISVSQLLTLYGGIDTGSANTYQLTFNASFSSLTNGIVIYWVPANNNTGPSTLSVNGLGTIPIVNPNGSTLGANQIVAGSLQEVVYYAGNFQLVSVSSFTGSTIGTFGTETPLASATTTDLGSAQAHVVLINGTTTITSFGTSASLSAPIYLVRFGGALLLSNSTNLQLPGNMSITTAAGDSLLAEYLGAGSWKVYAYWYGYGSTLSSIKPSDTSITSNAVLTADPDLQSGILQIGRYSYELFLIFDSATAAAGFQFTNDGTAIDSRAVSPALAAGYINGAAYGPKSEAFYGNTVTYATVSMSANSNVVTYTGSLLVSTVGNLGISWAQATSEATATTLRAGSYLTLNLLNTGTTGQTITRIYTSVGTFTETIPSGYNTLIIEVFGGSGGGGYIGTSGGFPPTIYGGGGGGSGGYARSSYPVTGDGTDTISYTVGAAGVANGASGGTSSVSSGTFVVTTMTSTGGTTGSAGTGGAPGGGGAGGAGTGGTVLNSGGNSGSGGSIGGAGGAGAAGVAGVYAGGNPGGAGAGIAAAGGTGIVVFHYS